jgi:hypothetical protein
MSNLWHWLTTPSGKPGPATVARWLWDAPIAAHTFGAIVAALLGHVVFALSGWRLGAFVLLLAGTWQLAKWDDGVYGRDWLPEMTLRLLIAVPWAVGVSLL